jgi:hypothetical protein
VRSDPTCAKTGEVTKAVRSDRTVHEIADVRIPADTPRICHLRDWLRCWPPSAMTDSSEPLLSAVSGARFEGKVLIAAGAKLCDSHTLRPSRRARHLAVARSPLGRARVVLWSAAGVCNGLWMRKSGGTRTASSSRRVTAAGAPPIGKRQRAPRRHGACSGSGEPLRRGAQQAPPAARLDDRSNRQRPRHRAAAPAHIQACGA